MINLAFKRFISCRIYNAFTSPLPQAQDEMKEILEKEKKEIWDEMQASLQVNNTRL